MTYILAWFILNVPLGFVAGRMMTLNTYKENRHGHSP